MKQPFEANRWFRALFIVASVFTFLLITLGGVVRVTGSGLGCPDWPLCYGGVIPPVEFATLIEYSHRTVALLTAVVIVAIGSIAVIKYRKHSDILTLSVLAVVLVIIQGILGWLTVLTELTPKIVTLHMGVALLLFGVIAAGLVVANTRDYYVSTSVGGRSIPLLGMLTLLALYVLALSGAYVRQSGSLGTCMTWPLCDGQILSGSLLVLTHITHRIGSVVVGLMIISLCTSMWKKQTPPLQVILAGVILSLYVGQIFVGASMIWTGLSAWTRALHLSLGAATFGSVVILLTLLMCNVGDADSSRINQGTER